MILAHLDGPRSWGLCAFARDSVPAAQSSGLNFPEIRLCSREPTRPGLRLNCSRGWEEGCFLSHGKSPLVFSSPEASQCDLSGGLGGAEGGSCPPKSTLALSPIEIAGVEWGRGVEETPQRYYIRRKLPHVNKELGFC